MHNEDTWHGDVHYLSLSSLTCVSFDVTSSQIADSCGRQEKAHSLGQEVLLLAHESG